ncbi:MOSC domain-containing protein [Hyphococcus sp.]|uniref:MOSC domain-containing protein n=1 Tax=Hyphococcus sp. TaxID=2038636 RepID=UPI003CCBF1C6
MSELKELINGYAHPGRVEWIGVRAERRGPVIKLSAAKILEGGVEGDHRQRPGKRAVTLIQWEHLPVIAALVGAGAIDPGLVRRNIAVSGINLLGLRNRPFRIGGAVLAGTGLCAPCSRMEEALGKGGYAAVRGHGGITARVIEAGSIASGDSVEPL